MASCAGFCRVLFSWGKSNGRDCVHVAAFGSFLPSYVGPIHMPAVRQQADWRKVQKYEQWKSECSEMTTAKFHSVSIAEVKSFIRFRQILRCSFDKLIVIGRRGRKIRLLWLESWLLSNEILYAVFVFLLVGVKYWSKYCVIYSTKSNAV